MTRGSSPLSKENRELLEQLDALIAQKDEIDMVKESQIESLKKQMAATRNLEERFWITNSIFDEYKTFDSDSALLYGNRAVDIANQLGRPDLADNVHVTLSYTYAAIGLLDDSADELLKVDTSRLTPAALVDYLGQQVYLITHIEQFKKIRPEVENMPRNASVIIDSIQSVIEPSHPDYLYYLGYTAFGSPNDAKDAIAKIEPAMEYLNYNNQRDAKLAWMLAQLYGVAGDNERRLHYLLLSAIADMRMSNREISSLEEAAHEFERIDDIQHAYNFIEHSMQCAEMYKNRVRALRLASMQREITRQYQEKFRSMQRNRTVYMVLIIVLALVLAYATYYTRRQHNRLKVSNAVIAKANEEGSRRLAELSDAYARLAQNNHRLVALGDELRIANDRLSESDYVKVQCIGNIFKLCSRYVDKIEKTRRSLARLLRASQFDKALKAAESTEQANKDLKEFYSQFDDIFLSVYPDFVDNFNALLQPGEEITPKTPGTLNTELRIYALIRLGITDSVTIAEVLHCSVQTVYNKRLKVRNKAAVSRDNFAEVVRNLGHATRKDESVAAETIDACTTDTADNDVADTAPNDVADTAANDVADTIDTHLA